jgi:hypothetical protein
MNVRLTTAALRPTLLIAVPAPTAQAGGRIRPG